MALARADALLGLSEQLVAPQRSSGLVAGALASPASAAGASAALEAASAELKAVKHAFVDQRAKVLLAASLATDDPFAPLVGGARQAQDAVTAERRAAVGAAKQELEAARQEVGRLSEALAAQHASLQLAKSQLATEAGLLQQARDAAAAAGSGAPAAALVVDVHRSADGARQQPPARVAVTSEAQARELIAEQTLAASALLADAAALEVARQTAHAEASRAEADAGALQQELALVRAERAAAARVRQTEAQRAGEAAAFYNSMSGVLAASVAT